MADAWDATFEADPDDEDQAYLYASKLRNLKTNISERMERDHAWESAGQGGKHNKVTFPATSDPATTVGEICFFAKDDGAGNTEIYYRREGMGDIVKLTRTDGLVIDDHSADAAAQATSFDPGETGSQNLADGYFEEIESLRYALERLAHGNAKKTTGGANKALWLDHAVLGHNMQVNPAFVDNSAAGAAPAGYTKVGSPPTMAPDTIAVSGGVGRHLRIVANAASQGLSNTLAGLRAGRRYLVGLIVKPDVGVWRLTTTGAASPFGNLQLDTSGTNLQTLAGVIQTDGTPTNIVWNLLSTANGDDVKIQAVFFFELGVERGGRTIDGWVRQRTSTVNGNVNATNIDAIKADTLLPLIAPGPGYSFKLEVMLKWFGDNDVINVALQRQINGGGFITVLEYADGATDVGFARGRVVFTYIEESPTPGSLYEYQITCSTVGGTAPSFGPSMSATSPHYLIGSIMRRT